MCGPGNEKPGRRPERPRQRRGGAMATLKETLLAKIQEHRPRTQKLVKEHANVKIGEVTIGQAIGGARGVRMLVTDISYLDPFEGIRFRGQTLPEVMGGGP